MLEFLIGAITILFLYWLGGALLPDYEPIQQELIKMEEE
jgi:hypothetical protein